MVILNDSFFQLLQEIVLENNKKRIIIVWSFIKEIAQKGSCETRLIHLDMKKGMLLLHHFTSALLHHSGHFYFSIYSFA